MNKNSDGKYDYTSLIDPVRYAKAVYEIIKRKSVTVTDFLNWAHELYLSGRTNESGVVEDINSKYNQNPLENSAKPIIMSNGDIVSSYDYQQAIVSIDSNPTAEETKITSVGGTEYSVDEVILAIEDSNPTAEETKITSVGGTEYSVDEVILAIEDSSVSWLCFDSAMQSVAASAEANSSTFLNHVPNAVKGSSFFDSYSAYYTNLLDDDNLTPEVKAQTLVNIGLSTEISDPDTKRFIINVDESLYTGVSPFVAWCQDVNIDFTQIGTWLSFINPVKMLYNTVKITANLLWKIISPVVDWVSDKFSQDCILQTKHGKQNLLDVPAYQIQFKISEIFSNSNLMFMSGPGYDGPVNNQPFSFLSITRFLYGSDDVTSTDFINWLISLLGSFPRLEIPLKGCTYFISLSDDRQYIIFQCFIGLLSTTGIDKSIIKQSLPALGINSHGSNLEVRRNYSTQGEAWSLTANFLDDIRDNLQPVELGEITSNAQAYQAMYLAYRLSLVYPLILSGQNSFHCFVDDQTTIDWDTVYNNFSGFCGVQVYDYIDNVLQPDDPYDVPEGNEFGRFTNFDATIADPTNADVINCLNYKKTINLTNWDTFGFRWCQILANIIYPLADSYDRSLSKLTPNAYSFNITTDDDFLGIGISNSIYSISNKFYVVTDDDNKSKFSDFLKVVGATAAVLATGIVIGKVVRAVSVNFVKTQSEYLNTLNKLSGAVPYTREYSAIAANGVKQMRVLRRYATLGLGLNTGTANLSFTKDNNVKEFNKICSLLTD